MCFLKWINFEAEFGFLETRFVGRLQSGDILLVQFQKFWGLVVSIENGISSGLILATHSLKGILLQLEGSEGGLFDEPAEGLIVDAALADGGAALDSLEDVWGFVLESPSVLLNFLVLNIDLVLKLGNEVLGLHG